jgi:hypothetical protein
VVVHNATAVVGYNFRSKIYFSTCLSWNKV